MNKEGLFRTIRERIRERKDVEGLLQAFAVQKAPERGTSATLAPEEPDRRAAEEGGALSLRRDRRAVPVEAEELLGRIGDARSLEPLLRMLNAGEEKA